MGNKIKIGDRYQYPVSKGSELDEILQLLQNQGAMPTYSLSDDVQQGAFSPARNTIKLNPATPGSYLNNLLTHESTHALDSLMGNEAYKNPNTQFAEGLSKMFAPTRLPLNPQWGSPEYSQYRNSPEELRAFGVGNMGSGVPMEPNAPHVDATMATEEAILRELFKRHQQAR